MHFILFAKCKSIKNPIIKINDNVIQRVNIARFWGIYINERLSFQEKLLFIYLSYIGCKLLKGIVMSYPVSSVINMDAIRCLFCTLILPYLSYCAVVLGNTYTTNLMPIFLKQKKTIRIVCNVKYRGLTPVIL